MLSDNVLIKRYLKPCPGCGMRQSIIRKLWDKEAYCEECGRGYRVELLDSTAENEDILQSNRGRLPK
ncbi:hypothetical protein ACFLWK_00200 [Chloroflexota bacterium]